MSILQHQDLNKKDIMKQHFWAVAFVAVATLPALAELPDSSLLNGYCGAALKERVGNMYYPTRVPSYGDDTWDLFKTSDVRTIDGKEAWFDMYSNRLVYVESGHSGLNIEHCVANSWWGGTKIDAYKDCFNLNPSDADANVRKSNNPLGEIAGIPTWSNGLSNVGHPLAGLGGGASTVFEPADEYKGDFARAYFYMFTIYSSIDWADAPACMYDLSAYPTLQPWAYEMLLRWDAEDPVDEREAKRNAVVGEYQFNENPFVVFKDLAKHIWGEKKDVPYVAEDLKPVANRPEAPVFGGDYYLAAVNTWTGRWWNTFTLSLSAASGCDIYYSLNGSEYKLYDNGIAINGATKAGDVVTVSAYAVAQDDDLNRRSSIGTLTLTAVEEGKTDYMHAKWSKVSDQSEITTDDVYVVVASDTNALMSATVGATSSSGYYAVSGTAEISEDGTIFYLPEETAVFTLTDAGGGHFYLGVNNLALEHKGFVAATAAKKLTMSNEGMPVAITVNEDGTSSLSLGSTYGTIQYNAQSPRFSVYTSKQKPVSLYRCVGNPTTGVPPVIAETAAEASASVRIFTLEGIEVGKSLTELPGGLYIVVDGNGVSKKCLIRK